MKVEVIMPKMGESLQEGTIIKWFKKVGDKIERDEMILEISTDKVDTEVPSPVAGTLAEILANPEDVVEVGKVIAYIETDANVKVVASAESNSVVKESSPKVEESVKEEPEKEEPVKSTSNTSADAGSLVDLVMPKMGESLQEGTVIKWMKNIGDKINRDEMVLEISTDKVDTDVPSPVAGVLAEILANEGDTVEVGVTIARISTSGSVPVSKSQAAAESTPPKVESAPAQTVSTPQVTTPVAGGTTEIPRKHGDNFFSPLVRKIAEDNKVTLEELLQLQGSGADGRIVKKDILAYIDKRTLTPSTPTPTEQVTESKPTPVTKSPAPVISGPDKEIIPMDRMRQLIAEHMVMSKRTSAHVTSVAEADVTNIVKFREKFKGEFEAREGFKLTYTPFFAKAALEGITQFPMINISVDGKNIIRHRRINIGMATALPSGNLIVPVIKNADALSLTGLARSIYDLATRARSKELLPDDIQGGTFTITNVGTFGTLFGTPVINQPQVAIMGIGAIKKRPVVKEIDGQDAIVIRQMAYVSITYDHRVVDGMLAGQCLKAIATSLENMNEKTLSL